MKNRFACFSAAACAVVFLFTTAHAGAKTLLVGKTGSDCPEAQYNTIAGAVAAAGAGDVVAICPALYAEQLVITKPLTLRGVSTNAFERVLLKPVLSDLLSLPTEAVITVMNTHGVTIDNLAIDASNNAVSSCSPGVAGVHFYNASGTVKNSAIFGATLPNPLSCTSLPFGNGFGIRVDSSVAGSYYVSVLNNSIHGYTANGVQVYGTGITADIAGNTISGTGPATGIFQFAVFLFNGAVGNIHDNVITEGLCGSVSAPDCINTRSEGITLRSIGDGTLVERNVIQNAQSGIFINGANQLRVLNNVISNIDAMSGLDMQATASGYFTNNVIAGNIITNVGPIDQNASTDEEGCGINEYPGNGIFSGNEISHNTVNDAYCGVAHVTADWVNDGVYFNTLYKELDAELYPVAFPPATEP